MRLWSRDLGVWLRRVDRNATFLKALLERRGLSSCLPYLYLSGAKSKEKTVSLLHRGLP